LSKTCFFPAGDVLTPASSPPPFLLLAISGIGPKEIGRNKDTNFEEKKGEKLF
jgi:hypothetical protein